MPIDPSIALQTRGIALPDPMAMATQTMQLSNLGMQNQTHQYALQQAMRQDAANEALSRALPQAIQGQFAPDVMQRLMQGNPAAAPGLWKAQEDYQARQQKQQVTDATVAKDRDLPLLERYGNMAYNLAQQVKSGQMNPAIGAGLINDMRKNGLDKYVTLPPFQSWNDPGAVSQFLENVSGQAYSIKDRVTNAETGRHNLTTEGLTGSAQAETGRHNSAEELIAQMNARTNQGQLGVAQGRLGLERQNANKPVIQTGQNGEIFTIDPRAGTGRTVTGEDGQPLSKGQKPLTEVQGNATAFGMRMKAANDIINGLEDQGMSQTNPLNKLAGNSWTNVLAPEKSQELQQAKLNFMSASLRKESGAAISQSEYVAEDRKYFPQIGDSPGVVAQKRAMRDLAMQAMSIQAGQQGTQSINKVSGVPGGGKSLPGWSVQKLD